MQRALLICVSILLLLQAFSALRAGRIATAGICLGGFAFAVVTLRRWYGSDPAPNHGIVTPQTPSIARGAAVAAIVYPEQIARIGGLLTAIGPAAKDVLVLIVQPTSAPTGAPAITSAEDVLRRYDPRLVSDLAREVERSGGSFHVMCAFGVDVAMVVLDVARTLGASRVVVLRAEDTDAAEEQRRAVSTWNRLPVPRQSLRVDLVGGSADVPCSFELPAA